MTKILFCLTHDLFVKNYLINGALYDLERLYECYYIADKTKVTIYSKELEKKKNFLGYYDLNESLIKKYRRFFWIRLFKNKINSRGLNLKKKEYLALKLNWGKEKIIKKIVNYPLRILSYFKRNIFYLFSFLINEKKYTNNFYRKNNIDEKIFEYVDKLNPDLGVYFAQGENHGFIEFIRACNKLNIKTLQIVGNWDNMSAKNISIPRPHSLAVLSKQQKDFANKIHGFPINNIHVLGSKKYDNFFDLKNCETKSNYKFKYLLFLEGWVWTDEKKTFDHLNDFIENEKTFKNYKILYRPHPLRSQNYNLINLNKYKNIILDPQMEKSYHNRNFNLNNIPNEKYYISLIKNSELVICGPTSMILESIILDKKILVLAFKSKKYYNNYNFIKNMINYEYLNNVPSVKINYSLSNLKEDMLSLQKIELKDKYETITKCLDYLIHSEQLNYSQRLKNILDNIKKQ
jgi:hypothetical protein